MRRLRFLAFALVALLAAVSAVGAQSAQTRTYMATLSSAEEVPTNASTATGQATFQLSADGQSLTYRLTVNNIQNVTAAHIHVGDWDEPGPVVVPLSPPIKGESKGCVAVSRTLIKAIANNPSHYYVNVHSTKYPAGAIRGQLRD